MWMILVSIYNSCEDFQASTSETEALIVTNVCSHVWRTFVEANGLSNALWKISNRDFSQRVRQPVRFDEGWTERINWREHTFLWQLFFFFFCVGVDFLWFLQMHASFNDNTNEKFGKAKIAWWWESAKLHGIELQNTAHLFSCVHDCVTHELFALEYNRMGNVYVDQFFSLPSEHSAFQSRCIRLPKFSPAIIPLRKIDSNEMLIDYHCFYLPS